jgi:hypothetical protein
MWVYKNVTFIYTNEVDSVYKNRFTFPAIYTYVKSKYALMEALQQQVNGSYLGAYTQVDQRTVKHDPPVKV